MKNRFLAASLLLGSLIAGCSEAEVEDVTKVTTDSSSAKVVEVLASHGSYLDTRVGVTINPDAAVGEDYITYNWEFDDVVGVLYRRGAANVPTPFYVKRNTISEDKASAILTGTIDSSLIGTDGFGEMDGADDGVYRVGAILHSTYATNRDPSACSFDISVQSTAGEVEAEDVVMLASSIYNDNEATIESFNFQNYSSILDLTATLHSSFDGKSKYEISGLDEAVLTITGSNLTNSATFDLISGEEITAGTKRKGGIRATLTSIEGKGTPQNPLRAPITIFPTSDDKVLGDLSFEFRTLVDGITAVYNATLSENSAGNYIEAGKYYTLDLELERQMLADGDTEDQPIKIATKEDLFKVAEDINNGTKTGENVYYKMVADVDLEGEEWTPIGCDATKPFMGNFDGNGKTISGLKITSDIKNAGLIGVMKVGYLKNLTVKGDININSTDRSASQYAGGLIAYMPINTSGPAVALSGNLTSEVNVTYKYDVTLPYVMPEADKADTSVNIGGAFGYLSISAESVAPGTVITSGAEAGGTQVDVVTNSSIIYVGGVAGITRASTNATITAETYTNNIVRMINNTTVTAQGYPTPEMQANCFIYVGGLIGYVTNANINAWRGTVTAACEKVHGFASPKNDSASKIYARWVCVGGFAGDINAVNMFYYSNETDMSTKTDLIAGLTADAADSSTKTALFGEANDYPTYKVLVGTYAGTKGVLTGGGNANVANKQPNGSGSILNNNDFPVVVRSNNYFQLYSATDAKAFLSSFFHMSHSGYAISAKNWDSKDSTYPTVNYVNLYND